MPSTLKSSLSAKLINPHLFELLDSPVWADRKKIEEVIIEKAKYYSLVYIVINNPSLLIKYFILILNLKLKFSSKFLLIITLHSRMFFRLSFFNPIGEFIVSVIAILFSKRINYVSQYIKMYWESKFFWLKRANSLVVKNGIALKQTPKIRVPPSELRVGFVGRFDPDKHPLLFNQVAKLASLRHLNFTFHMYGEGSLKEKLVNSRSTNLFIHSWNEADEIYKLIDVILITSPIETSSYVLLEAKSFGIPVITCSNGGITELYSSGFDGIFLASNTPEDFLLAIERISAEYPRYSANCLSKLGSFDAHKLSGILWSEFIGN